MAKESTIDLEKIKEFSARVDANPAASGSLNEAIVNFFDSAGIELNYAERNYYLSTQFSHRPHGKIITVNAIACDC